MERSIYCLDMTLSWQNVHYKVNIYFAQKEMQQIDFSFILWTLVKIVWLDFNNIFVLCHYPHVDVNNGQMTVNLTQGTFLGLWIRWSYSHYAGHLGIMQLWWLEEYKIRFQIQFEFICSKMMSWWKGLDCQLCSMSLFLNVLLWRKVVWLRLKLPKTV